MYCSFVISRMRSLVRIGGLASAVLVLLSPLVTSSPVAVNSRIARKNIPGDPGWPTQETWAGLNQTVCGRLIATVPQAAVCHSSGYATKEFDQSACEDLQTVWDFGQTFEPYPGEIMNPYFQNQSCDPFTSAQRPCELGNYVSYSIAVSGAQDVVAGIQFTRESNVRLVIKNTGHDFLGKSTGTGGLALWTSNLKTTEIIPAYKSDKYRGPAIKLGAGVAGYEAYAAAEAAGYRVVGGDCPTVGISGGYTQGGGHSLLNSAYGMAADQVLEWEVVTAQGEHLIATPTENEDLYWALSGGGPGTFAVVLSMTVKIYPEGPVGGASLRFNQTSAGKGAYLAAMESWWKILPAIVDTGATALWTIDKTGFNLESLTALDKSADEVAAMIAPFLSTLDRASIPYEFTTEESATYYEHYAKLSGPLPYGAYPVSMLFDSRLIPRAITADPARVTNLTATMESFMDGDEEADWHIGCKALNVRDTEHPDNAVAPFWRDAIAVCITISLWDWTIPRSDMLARREYLADVIAPAIQNATPESGAYLNEADPLVHPPESLEWQWTFYGSNYARLREVKDKWDPESLFYARTAVGSEDWVLDGDGRLCKA